MRARVGIDLGGTKIEIAVLDERAATLLRRRVPTPQGDYRGTLDAIASLVAAAEEELGPARSVGIGIPGAILPATQLVKNANSVVLNGKPLHADLEALLRRPVRLANDANCLALSEAVDGAAAGANVTFAAILGTGVGGGIAIAGRPWTGANAIAGEWGHNPLPWPRDDERPGQACYCGKYGCVETFLSGPGLARAFAEEGGADADARTIADLAQRGDALAASAMERYEDRLARALATVVNVLDPDVVVLGGGVSNVARLYDVLPGMLARYAFSDRFDTPVRRAQHGDSSGVRGAAMLWPA